MSEELLKLTVRLHLALVAPTAPRRRDERGDVPGWVMVTVMTAGLVTVLWQLAGDQLTEMLSSALDSVKG
jgi:hypothetical protein